MITTAAVVLGTLAAVPAAIAGIMYTRQSKATLAFFNPVDGGGSWLDNAGVGVGEPLNVSRTIHHTIPDVAEVLIFHVTCRLLFLASVLLMFSLMMVFSITHVPLACMYIYLKFAVRNGVTHCTVQLGGVFWYPPR